MPSHPICSAILLEGVAEVSVAEDMNHQFTIGLKPLRTLLEQTTIVPHMLKHLDGYDTVKLLINLEVIHILRNHGNSIADTKLICSAVNILSLRSRV